MTKSLEPVLFAISFLLLVSCQSKLQRLNQLIVPTSFVNVVIDPNTSPSAYQPCEPSIFISPTDPNLIVAGIVLDKIFYSEDQGMSWTMQIVESPYGVFGDPVITADHLGNFYYGHLADPSGRGRSSEDWLDRIVVQTSKDNGKNWTDGSFAGHRPTADQDKQWLVVDPVDHHIYMTWTEFDKYGSAEQQDKSRILFSKSIDGAQSWSEARAINQLDGNCLDGDQTPEGAVPAVGVQSQIYVAWSFDEKIYFDRSIDKGTTWLEKDIVACDQDGGWDFDIPGLGRANGMPITATDLSKSEFRGNIYINYCDQINGKEDTDVWLIRSSDHGDTWSTPIRVNDDPPGRHQFFTWMAVDQKTGAIYIVFYDRRNHRGNLTDVYLAYSFDGGQTFTNVKVSDTAFEPNTTVFFGDYNNISAYDGVVRPIWTRMDGNKTSVWTALINF